MSRTLRKYELEFNIMRKSSAEMRIFINKKISGKEGSI